MPFPEFDMSVRDLLADASVAWSFETPPPGAMVHGDVRFDVQGTEGSATADGIEHVAEFRGGWLEIRIPDLGSLAGMTFHTRIRIPSGDWNVPIFSICDDDGQTAMELTGRRTGTSEALAEHDALQHYSDYCEPNLPILALEAVLGFCELEDCIEALREQHEFRRQKNPDLPPFAVPPDLAAGLLRIGVPVQLIGATDWHDVTVRFTGPNLELFVDGVLVDEEWAVGAIRPCRICRIGAAMRDGAPSAGLCGFMEYAALWDRALSDEEIVLLAGGEDKARTRELEILGLEQSSLQYWKPRGHNTFAGDTSCFFDGRRWHLFYLFDRRHHHSKWHAGAHQFAHASTKDLIHWQHHPLAIPIDEQWLTCGTANCILHEGRYHFFYGMHTERLVPMAKTVRPDMLKCLEANGYFDPIPFDAKSMPSGLACAVSDDGIHFRKERLTINAAENGFVFHELEGGLYQMLTGRERFTSTDLRRWILADPHFLPLYEDSPANNTEECPCYFTWNGWHYIIMGKTGFWMSRHALGPYWKALGTSEEIVAPRWDIYDGTLVPMAAPFHGNRMILAGWLGEQSPSGKLEFGGHLVFRELIQHSDGTLGMKWPEEMIPATGDPLELPFAPLTGGVKSSGRGVRIASDGEFSCGAFTGVPSRARITMQVHPGHDIRSFGVCLKGDGEYRSGCELRFDPARKRVQWGRPVNSRPGPDATTAAWSGRDFAIENVEGIDRPFTLDLVVRDDIFDACIDDNRTMVIRRKRLDGDRLFLFAIDGKVLFENIRIRPLVS